MKMKKSKTKTTNNNVFTNNKPKGRRFNTQNTNMGNEPLTSDIKSICLSSMTVSQREMLAV